MTLVLIAYVNSIDYTAMQVYASMSPIVHIVDAKSTDKEPLSSATVWNGHIQSGLPCIDCCAFRTYPVLYILMEITKFCLSAI